MKENNNVENIQEIDKTPEFDLTAKMTKSEKLDVIEAVTTRGNSRKMMKFIMDSYYQAQEVRIIAENRARAISQGYDEVKGEEHPLFIQRSLHNYRMQEALYKKYAQLATDHITDCRWMKSIVGIGDILSGYLYSALDVTKVQYATEFLSYAGLNDNNNKWLGKEGAQKLTSRAIKYREGLYSDIEAELKNRIQDQFGSSSKFPTIINKAFSLINNGNEYWFYKAIELVLKKEVPSNFLDGLDLSQLEDYIRWKKNPSRADMILYQYAALETKRKVSLIEKGSMRQFEKTKGGEDTGSNKEVSIENFRNYLAMPPYNTFLKKKCYSIGESFVLFQRKSMYGQIYARRLAEETIKNDQLAYKEQAERMLDEKNYNGSTTTYNSLIQGKLSKAHLIMRARRYAVKLFISHVFEAMYWFEYGIEPPKHYILELGGHHDYIAPEVDYHNFK